MRLHDELRLHERSPHSIWTDDHVARSLLAAHLDPDDDGATRDLATVERTIDWIAAKAPKAGSLLDLGCGPGIYAERFYARGFEVTGCDISRVSIDYARERARREGWPINYLHQDYLRDPIAGRYDVAVCIYCDFGALIPTEQRTLLARVHAALHDDGVFVFDVCGEGLNAQRSEGRSWSLQQGPSFWSPRAHLVLEEDVHFEEARAWGRRYLIVEDGVEVRDFVLWDHYFSEDEVAALLHQNGFAVESVERELFRGGPHEGVLLVQARRRGSPASGAR